MLKKGRHKAIDTLQVRVERVDLPAIVALSHPCNKLPIAAATATSTAPLIFHSTPKIDCYPLKQVSPVINQSNQKNQKPRSKINDLNPFLITKFNNPGKKMIHYQYEGEKHRSLRLRCYKTTGSKAKYHL